MNEPAPKTRLLIADDHPMVREWLAQLINREPNLIVCGEAADAAQTLQAIQTLRPDMVGCRSFHGRRHGTDLIKDITTRYEGLPVLVLFMHDEPLYAERALRAGARGYVTKREGAKKSARPSSACGTVRSTSARRWTHGSSRKPAPAIPSRRGCPWTTSATANWSSSNFSETVTARARSRTNCT